MWIQKGAKLNVLFRFIGVPNPPKRKATRMCEPSGFPDRQGSYGARLATVFRTPFRPGDKNCSPCHRKRRSDSQRNGVRLQTGIASLTENVPLTRHANGSGADVDSIAPGRLGRV